jgi:signal recognition particle subunit SRP54
MGKIKDQIAGANIDDKVFKRQRAIIDSMTPAERRNPDILKASRKRRIAAGSGTNPEQINRLLKMHRQMADMMKSMSGGKKGALGKMASMFGIGGGMPSIPPGAMEQLTKGQMPPGLPPGMPGLPPGMSGLPSGMPNLPPNFPGLPGLGGAKLPPGFPFGGGKKK